MSQFIWTLCTVQFTILCVTLYLHRGQAHRGVEFHSLVSHVMRAWLWLSTGINTKEWTAIHRKHHAKCETEEDPHSPHHKGIWNVLFKGYLLYRREALNSQTMQRYGHGTPNDWIERNIYSRYSFLGLVIYLAINCALFGWWGLLSWAIQIAWIPFWAAGVVNGLAHWWGYRNYECPDKSTNLWPLAIWIGGEELHNNHHGFAASAKFSQRPWEIDIGWGVIVVLNRLGLAKVKHRAPKIKLQEKEACDHETLNAVIAYRYAVLKRYSKKVMTDHFSLTREQQATIEQMKHRLELIWTTTRKNAEELLLDLQEWCLDAKNSGIKALADFANYVTKMHLHLA